MTDPSNNQSAAHRTAATLSHRLQRLLVVLVTALFGLMLTSVSFAAASPTHERHQRPNTPAQHAASHRTAAHATTTPSKWKSKHAVAQHPTQRKAPAKTRVAEKSKPATRAHQPPRKPAKLATKQTKHAA